MEMRVFKVIDSKDRYLRCEPIYYPDNVNLGVEDRLYVESSSGNLLASKTSILLPESCTKLFANEYTSCEALWIQG
jgi:hypothetical protein